MLFLKTKIKIHDSSAPNANWASFSKHTHPHTYLCAVNNIYCYFLIHFINVTQVLSPVEGGGARDTRGGEARRAEEEKTGMGQRGKRERTERESDMCGKY